MNQILVSSKVYVTKELKKKQAIYQAIFMLSIIIIVGLFIYYIFSEKQKNMDELVSQDIRSNLEIISTNQDDKTIITDKIMVVSLTEDDISDQLGPSIEFERVSNTNTNNDGLVISTEQKETSRKIKASNGKVYETESILEFPKLGISYPVLSEQNEELLKASICKYWGPAPNEVGNYCVVGHNYSSGKMFGKLPQAKNGDTFTISDLKGRTITYEVYDTFQVDPTDVSCTSQLTNGKKEVTLITCKEYGTKRFVVKAREK